MLFLNRIFSVLTLVILAGCGAGNDMRPDASAEVISSASYRHDGPAALTLYTMINNRSGAGAHSSVMINGSQRVIFDPAGTVRLSAVPERGDVLYGLTPQVVNHRPHLQQGERRSSVLRAMQGDHELHPWR